MYRSTERNAHNKIANNFKEPILENFIYLCYLIMSASGIYTNRGYNLLIQIYILKCGKPIKFKSFNKYFDVFNLISSTTIVNNRILKRHEFFLYLHEIIICSKKINFNLFFPKF